MNVKYIFSIVILGYILGGCTALKTFPQTAYPGDTIALAVGSPDGMTRANTTAEFQSDAGGAPVNLTIRSIFNLFADQKSLLFKTGTDLETLTASSHHEPWITIAVIDLPLGLTTGPGEVQFNTTAVYPAVDFHINDVPIDLEILAGGGGVLSGLAHEFEYRFGIQGNLKLGDLSQLEEQSHAVFSPTVPSVACPCPDYASIEVKVNMPTSFGASLTPDLIRVMADDLNVITLSNRSFTHNLNANGEDLTVIFTSVEGKLIYEEARFYVVPQFAGITFTGTPIVTSIKYFDIDGNEVAGPVADYTVAIR